MTTLKQKIIAILSALILVIGGGTMGAKLGGTSAVSTTASTTAYTVTTGTSVRVLATSTKRTAFSVQPINCATGAVSYLNLENPDAAATAAVGFPVIASTSVSFIDNADLPVNTNSVQAITTVGTCTLSVTEWTTNF